MDCGESDIVVLEFDHIGEGKVRDISQMISRARANDHRRRTARRGDHYRWSLGESADPPGSDPGVSWFEAGVTSWEMKSPGGGPRLESGWGREALRFEFSVFRHGE